MRHVPRALVAGGLGFATSLIIAACGGGAGLLSGDQANSLSSTLGQVSSAVSAKDCATADGASRSFAGSVSNLPSTISSNLRQDLIQGAATISRLAAIDCRTTNAAATTTPTTTAATTTTPTTSSTPTHTTTTRTTATTTTSATTPTNTGTTTTPSGGGGLSGGASGGGGPPSGDNRNGNGNGNGNG